MDPMPLERRTTFLHPPWIALLAVLLPGPFLGAGGVELGVPQEVPQEVPGTSAVASPEPPYTVERCSLRLELEPATGRLTARAELSVAASPAAGGALRFELHPALSLESAAARQGEVEFHPVTAPEERGTVSGEGDQEAAEVGPSPAVWELDWSPPPAGRDRVTVTYSGVLRQDVTAGESPGRIHNFQIRAHIGEEGIHLAESAAWVPRIPRAEDRDGEIQPLLLDLQVREIPGFVLVAAGERSEAAPEPGWTTWHTPFAVTGPVLHGGPLEEHRRRAGGVILRALVRPQAAPFTDALLSAVEGYLALYQPRLGPYPFRELAVVENFFSSGFAYPGFTLLGPGVIEMGEGALRPGYLDHELLHNWWGNGVLVSERDGNWAEALTSWCANYMRPVLEGRASEGRKQRRDIVQQLSRSEDPGPLDRFGLPGGPGNLIGYRKGSLVFAQLAREVGEETLWRALRRLFLERKGRATGWEDLRRGVEVESGRDLAAFFELWVRQGELPQIRVEEARWGPEPGHLRLVVQREGPAIGTVPLPLRLVSGGHSLERVLSTVPGRQTVDLLLPPDAPSPRTVEVDPDYQTLRRLPEEMLMPTLAAIRPPRSLTVVRQPDDWAAYSAVGDRFAERWEDEPGEAVRTIEGGFEWARLSGGHALILGRAVRSEDGEALMAEAGVELTEEGFAVAETAFTAPEDALLVCRSNPSDPAGVICAYLGNDERALDRAYLLPFYGGNSLIAFDAGDPVLRRDFERLERVEVLEAPP